MTDHDESDRPRDPALREQKASLERQRAEGHDTDRLERELAVLDRRLKVDERAAEQAAARTAAADKRHDDDAERPNHSRRPR